MLSHLLQTYTKNKLTDECKNTVHGYYMLTIYSFIIAFQFGLIYQLDSCWCIKLQPAELTRSSHVQGSKLMVIIIITFDCITSPCRLQTQEFILIT